jgi:multiple antibiotic resistance protein
MFVKSNGSLLPLFIPLTHSDKRLHSMFGVISTVVTKLLWNEKMVDWIPILKSLTGILAIVNPLFAVPIFVGLTVRQSPLEQQRTAKVTGVSVWVVLILAALIGELSLNLLGIRIDSFRVAGGILLLLMGITMLHAQPSGSRRKPEEIKEAEAKDNIGVVPLAIPIMAGPGAISLVILDYQQMVHWTGQVGICVNITIVSVLVWLTFSAAKRIANFLGTTGINIITRLMGLLLAALAVELIATGMTKLFPGLA